MICSLREEENPKNQIWLCIIKEHYAIKNNSPNFTQWHYNIKLKWQYSAWCDKIVLSWPAINMIKLTFSINIIILKYFEQAFDLFLFLGGTTIILSSKWKVLQREENTFG